MPRKARWPPPDHLGARVVRSGHARPAAKSLTGHSVSTAYELGWSELENGELLGAAEGEGFQVLVTTDMNLRRRLAVIVLTSTSWPRIRRELDAILRVIDDAVPRTYVEVPVP